MLGFHLFEPQFPNWQNIYYDSIYFTWVLEHWNYHVWKVLYNETVKPYVNRRYHFTNVIWTTAQHHHSMLIKIDIMLLKEKKKMWKLCYSSFLLSYVSCLCVFLILPFVDTHPLLVWEPLSIELWKLYLFVKKISSIAFN